MCSQFRLSVINGFWASALLIGITAEVALAPASFTVREILEAIKADRTKEYWVLCVSLWGVYGIDQERLVTVAETDVETSTEPIRRQYGQPSERGITVPIRNRIGFRVCYRLGLHIGPTPEHHPGLSSKSSGTLRKGRGPFAFSSLPYTFSWLKSSRVRASILSGTTVTPQRLYMRGFLAIL